MRENHFKWVAILSALPVLMWPVLMARIGELNSAMDRFLLFGMPVFALLCSYLAHYTYADRPEVSWILIGIVWLSYGGFLVLAL